MQELSAVNNSKITTVDPPTLASLTDTDEFEVQVKASAAAGRVLLVQFGSETCPLCPKFHDAVLDESKDFKFDVAYVDAHHSELPETFGIGRLPAFVLVVDKGTRQIVVANATPERLHDEVRAACPPILQLDEDF